MDKNSIKKYAVWARNELIARVTQKANQYGITEAETISASAESIHGKLLTPIEKKQRTALIEKIKNKGKNGFQLVMEEVAYTWFNRFTAIRFMEVNGYLPSHVRVFTDDENRFNPQILAEAIHLEIPGLNMNKVFELKQSNKTEELYKYLIITQCNALNEILPGMFQKIEDYSELLLPDNLLREGSVIARMISDIAEGDFRVTHDGEGQIEIIGWLYQYYISEKHEAVIDPLHGGVVNKEEIPAATQLFTTDWVVRYIVDNSVGRYWIERNPNSTLPNNLDYYISPKDGHPTYVNEAITPQDVTVFDPCVGSGHFLVYAFDVLMKIYTEYGYSERDASREILRNNIFGLDIDNRASQLAYFAIMMKARQYDRSLFRQNITPHIYCIEESNRIDHYAVEEYCGNNEEARKDIGIILQTFKDAQEYGSILQIPQVDFENLYTQLDEARSRASLFVVAFDEIEIILNVAKIMAGKYATVVTNPPYLVKFDAKLKEYVLKHYKNYSGDLFSVFIYRNFGFCKLNGYSGLMTPNTWMAANQYELLREFIIQSKGIKTFIQMAKGAFFKEATVDVCAFVLSNTPTFEKGMYIRLEGFKGDMTVQNEKALDAIRNPKVKYFYESSTKMFLSVPGKPLAYWLSEKALEAFEICLLKQAVETKQGFKTGNNDLFLRLWHEVSLPTLFLGGEKSRKKWFPCNKGGNYRKWYGNREYAVNWENDGYEIINYKDKSGKQLSRPQNISYNFREALTWSTLSSGPISFRYSDENMMFESKGSECFVRNGFSIYAIQGLLNSKVCMYYLAALAPTIDYSEGSILKVPYIANQEDDRIIGLVSDNIELSKTEWNSFEISWDFATHPFVKYANNLWDSTAIGATMCEFYGRDLPKHNSPIELCYLLWQGECADRFATLKTNEEEINRLFIDIYGLNDELSPEVFEKDITVRKAELSRDIRSFISYAVGCMFGRYSLDIDGIAYAGGEWDESQYTTFRADKDNVLPICDDEYFEDDIVGKFVTFVEVVFGKDSLEENLKFIADALGGSGSPRDVIRSYFLNDFYADHLKVYQKRPIYWQFDSGKKNGFKCLIYMHRYQPDTIARIRTDYVHEQQARYRTAISDLEQRIQVASTSERVKLTKQLQKLKDQETEIRLFEEKVHHLADQMIRIDLDDGVKHNYEIFKDVLTKIK